MKIKDMFFIISSTIILSGCAVNYVDSAGASHTIGFAHVVRKKNVNGESVADINQVQTIGIYFIKMERQSAIGLGYISATEVSLENNAAVEILIDQSELKNIEIQKLNSNVN